MPPLSRARPDLTSRWLPEPTAQPVISGRLYKVALHGFSDFERTSLGSFFRLVSGRTPAYELWPTASGSDFIVADAASQGSGLVPPECTVFIGTHAPEGAMATLPRPIDPVNIVRALDARVGAIESALATVDELANINEGRDQALFVPKRPRVGGDDNDPFYLEELAEVPIPRALLQLSLPLVHPPTNWDDRRAKDVLVVDDSTIALRFLEMRLRRLGYRVFSARTSVYALELLAQQSFAFVFLDVALAEGDRFDGLQLCRYLKERSQRPGEAAPVVIMVSGHATHEDRLRADFAGCDAYLTKPLDERDLVNALGRHDPSFGRTCELD